MILNEFLQIKLGVEFEDKYNALATREVFENKEKYPLIADVITNEILDAEYEKKEWNYESGFFDCDDIEFCADFNETMQLYHAFVTAFAKDVKDKPIVVKYASFGIDYLEYLSVNSVLDPYCHYLGMSYISILPNRTELVREVYYPLVKGSVCLGRASTLQYNRTFASENKKALKEIAKGFKTLCECNSFWNNRFENDSMKKHAEMLENGEIGYPCDCYEIRIGKNLLRFFTTERGFDSFCVLRQPIFDALTDEQRKNEVVERIKNVF